MSRRSIAFAGFAFTIILALGAAGFIFALRTAIEQKSDGILTSTQLVEKLVAGRIVPGHRLAPGEYPTEADIETYTAADGGRSGCMTLVTDECVVQVYFDGMNGVHSVHVSVRPGTGTNDGTRWLFVSEAQLQAFLHLSFLNRR
ncbi:MAG TPA: hypothetical protein VD971_02240 [Phycisphaerales bacterium]|nr:hypothetical protein [Phycisphaerales bacterium]